MARASVRGGPMRKGVNKVRDGMKRKKMELVKSEAKRALDTEIARLEEAKGELDKETGECRTAVEAKLRLVGNLVNESVPVDNNEVNNVVVRTWGTPREDAGLVNHVDLVTKLVIVELEAGADVAGGCDYFLKRSEVMLNQALINYGLSQEAMAQCAQLALFDEELYKGGRKDTEAKKSGRWMTLTWITADMKNLIIFDKVCWLFNLLQKGGRVSRKIFRVQLEKVKQFCITSPNEKESWEMIKNSEEY